MLAPKPCEACHYLFQPSRKERRFCSKKCKGKIQSIITRILPDINCNECGKLFRPYGLSSKFCSSACSGKSWSKRFSGPSNPNWKSPDIVCPVCKKIFHPAHKGRKHCSLECKHESRKKPRPQFRKLEDRACIICQSQFRPTNRYKKYCSKECGFLGISRDHSKILEQSARIKHTCKTCFKEFFTYKRTSKYCSKLCLRTYIRPKKPKNRPPYDHKLRQKIIARDQFCQICSTTEELHVHHINENPYDNRDDNLIVLCKICHAEKHEQNGDAQTAQLIRYGRYRGGRKPKPRDFALCPICNQGFEKRLARQKYCSRTCAGKPPRHNEVGMIPLICAFCGAGFLRQYGKIRNKDAPKFCTRACHTRSYWQQRRTLQADNSDQLNFSF